jgi:peptide/nickel transport system permease protein
MAAGWFARRVGGAIITLALTSVVVFTLTNVIPGDVARRILGREAPQEAVDAKRAELGLDRSLFEQFRSWLGGFLRGDWGTSYTKGEPVKDLVLSHLARSLQLGLLAFVVLVPLSLGLGLLAGLRHGSRTDRAISVLGLCGTATPEFVSGVILLILFSVRFDWLPSSARDEYGVRGLVLPVLCLIIVTVGYVTRMVRASVVATLERPYIRTARLKGISTGALVRRHVLRNSLIVPVTALGVQLRYLIGGLIAVEFLFNYPGIGSLLLESAQEQDIPTLQAATLVSGAVLLLTFTLTDAVYAWLDPRVSVGSRGETAA